jgi:hypothetical protein
MFWSTQSTLEETFHAFNDISSPDSDVLDKDRRASAAIHSESPAVSVRKSEKGGKGNYGLKGGNLKLGKSTGVKKVETSDGERAWNGGLKDRGGEGRLRGDEAGIGIGKSVRAKVGATTSALQERRRASHSFSIGGSVQGRRDSAS